MSWFGTDGIRGRVGVAPVDPQTFLHLGWALGRFAAQKRVLIAKDTRLSGYMLESALIAGLTSAGCDVFLTGPLPTPALAYLTHSLGAELGIMISASHNAYHDNGIKVFYQGAHKLTDFQQDMIEQWALEPMSLQFPQGKSYRLYDAPGRYLEFLKRHIQFERLENRSIILDCAHGAAYKVAPQLFEEYQAIVHAINIQPNGFNINEKCGVLALGDLENMMAQVHSDYAIAFDGDADRVVLYIEGKKCDPHYMLLMLFDLYKRRYNYDGGIIGTQLHNQGLVEYCHKNNIPWVATPVGDRHLIAAARDNGFKIAGEPSGHYILMDKLSTADGLLTALLIIDEIELGYAKDLQWYEDNVPLFPAYSHSFPLDRPKYFMQNEAFQWAIQLLKTQNSSLILVIRPSGTESVIRVYVEGAISLQEFQKIISYLQCVIHEIQNIEKTIEGACFAKDSYIKLEASLGGTVGFIRPFAQK